MKWSRELRIARRSLRTAVRAASAMASARAKLSEPRSTAIPPTSGLAEVADFGSNPGRLSMLVQLPNALAAGAPLVVLLHGCGQTAATFARESGWTALAERLGVPLVLPEQSEANNSGRCFNWFRPTHTRRDFGEALSIRQMVAASVERFNADPRQIFIAGLSAGGAMTAALLAAYPDVFAGGAVVAGLPVGAASSTTEALHRMAEAGPVRTPAAWAEQVRRAAPTDYRGPWPRISIWHGQADRVVDPANARLLATQWSAVHGLGAGPAEITRLPGMLRERWSLPDRAVVDLWSLPESGHQWPQGAAEKMAAFWEMPCG